MRVKNFWLIGLLFFLGCSGGLNGTVDTREECEDWCHSAGLSFDWFDADFEKYQRNIYCYCEPAYGARCWPK